MSCWMVVVVTLGGSGGGGGKEAIANAHIDRYGRPG